MIKNWSTYIREYNHFDREDEVLPMEFAPLRFAHSNFSKDVVKKLKPLLIGKRISFWYWYKVGASTWGVGKEENIVLKDIIMEDEGDKPKLGASTSISMMDNPYKDIYFIVGDDNRKKLLHTNHKIEINKEDYDNYLLNKRLKREEMIAKMAHVDPYGEEEWGTNEATKLPETKYIYLKGDAVRIKPNLRQWIRKHDWDPGMEELIGKKLTIDFTDSHSDDGYPIAYFTELEEDWIPIECLAPWPTSPKRKEDGKIKWFNKGKLEKINIKL